MSDILHERKMFIYTYTSWQDETHCQCAVNHRNSVWLFMTESIWRITCSADGVRRGEISPIMEYSFEVSSLSLFSSPSADSVHSWKASVVALFVCSDCCFSSDCIIVCLREYSQFAHFVFSSLFWTGSQIKCHRNLKRIFKKKKKAGIFGMFSCNISRSGLMFPLLIKSKIKANLMFHEMWVQRFRKCRTCHKTLNHQNISAFIWFWSLVVFFFFNSILINCPQPSPWGQKVFQHFRWIYLLWWNGGVKSDLSRLGCM